MHIIPAIDIIDGSCVRLEQGRYEKKTVYYKDPTDVAKMFVDHGVTRLHLVDLDGAKVRKVVNWKVLEKITKATTLLVDWGGGIKSKEDLQIVFSCGARQATVGSIAAEDADLFHLWLAEFGSEKLILGADLKDGKVATRGWQETSDLDWREFFKLHVEQGVQTIISTDIAKDGMLSGPATELYKEMLKEFPDINLIASGGVAHIDDLTNLKLAGCTGAIVGKAIYENKISLTQLQEFITHAG